MNSNSSFYKLEPDIVLNAIEEYGFHPTGEITQLNSYENRVFEVKVESKEKSVIAKFYRPQRWSEEALKEEHSFLEELKNEGIEAVAPLKNSKNSTLIHCAGMWVSLFPKIRGRMVQEFNLSDLKSIGRLLARVHNVGSKKSALHRPSFDESHPGGDQGLELLQAWIAPEVKNRYNQAAEGILSYLNSHLRSSDYIRVHGDAHRGNLLSTGDHFFLVYFDDFGNGLPVQDFWMLLSGDPSQDSTAQGELEALLEGYQELRGFDSTQLKHIPALRGLRIISYASWIAKRWEDPFFPKIFPDFETYTYWAEEVEQLEKIAWSL